MNDELLKIQENLENEIKKAKEEILLVIEKQDVAIRQLIKIIKTHKHE